MDEKIKGWNLTGEVLRFPPILCDGSSLKMVDDCCCRLEKVALSCLYSKVKIAGTILCVLGALTMGLMQSTVSSNGATPMPPLTDVDADMIFDKDKIAGCLYLVAAVFVLSSNIVLQVMIYSSKNKTRRSSSFFPFLRFWCSCRRQLWVTCLRQCHYVPQHRSLE